jgi:putative ATP-dependent endonuclease of the OLD family
MLQLDKKTMEVCKLLVQKLSVMGLKSLKDVSFKFEKFSIVIGKNDIGKSSTLRALDIFLNDSKPNRDEITINNEKLEITITFKLSKEELENKELTDQIDSYLDIDKLEVKKVYAIDDKDISKIKTTEIYIKNEKVKPSIWKNISAHLPQYIYVESIRDIDKATKMTSGSILGKLVMPLITKQKEVADGILSLKDTISRNIGSIVKEIESYLKEQSPDVHRLIPKSDVAIDKAVEMNLFVDDGFSETAIGGKGSGIQSSLVVSLFRAYAKYHVGKDIIFGIEEPDAYLHVGAQRKIFHSLQSVTENDGQVILTTHSTVFIDRGNLNGITLLKRNENGEVEAKRIKDEKHIDLIQENLEIRNSDLLQWDGVLMVEGATEKTVIDIWAKKLSINLDSIGLKLLVIGGKDKAMYFANAQILDDLGIPYAVLLDSDEKNPQEFTDYLVKQTKLEKANCFVLQKREIENYYPKGAIEKAFPKSNFESVTFGPNEDVKQQLETLTKRSPAVIGRKVAELMSIEEIPNEIKSALNYLGERILKQENSKQKILAQVAVTKAHLKS